ncbi:MAG: heparinase II/III-family protein [Lachnospiraceae bacterium]|nr:heparinase II/III-family protein [Lachnospiraceae bacterium]
MYTEIAKNISELHDFKPFPKACERDGYEALPSVVTENALSKAESYLNYEFKAIPITAFMEFSRNGNRSHFESLNFEKRHALNALVMGECIEHKGRFMDGIVNGIYSLCEESAWQLPAHNSYERGGQNYPLPDVTDPVIDLFAAETGALLATVSYLLSDELDEVSPFINKMISSELTHRIYEPYMNRHFWWMGNGSEPMCNWTVWCIQNVLNSVFLLDSSEEFARTVINKASYSIDCFLKDYGEDGCCDEGPHYYRRSALCLFNATLTLNAVTGGMYTKVFSEPKIKNIADYIFNVNVDGRYYINYADCSAVLDRACAGEFLFAKAIDDAEMMRYAANDYKMALKENLPKNEEEINLFNRMQELFASADMLAYDTSAHIIHKECYYESVGLFIARDRYFTLAVKAGDNDDSHNHNDTGSITLYKDGKPILIDVGVETYTAKTFSDERYDIWTMQSQYHNLPTINGVMQSAGAGFKASNVRTSFDSDISDISMDIAGAYPESAGVSSYTRHVSLIKGKRVVVEDKVAFTNPEAQSSYSLNLMFAAKPEIAERTIKIPGASIEFSGDVMLSCEVIPITDSRLKWAWTSDIYRVIAVPAGEAVSFTVT